MHKAYKMILIFVTFQLIQDCENFAQYTFVLPHFKFDK